MNSLRAKVTTGYVAIGGLILIVALVAFVELRFIEDRTLVGERIGEFFDATLEVRRFEKNFLLYRQRDDLAAAREYLDRARQLLHLHRRDFVALSSSERVARLTADLDRYATQVARLDERTGEAPEAGLRATGKAIVEAGEALAHAERASLRALIGQHRQRLLWSIALLTLGTLVAALALARLVTHPLRGVEQRMNSVARGNRDPIALTSRDREIVSLTQAFNRVLHELEVRQRHLVRSEKLAALGTMLSGVAHELNNPLSNISSSAQILAEEVGSGGPAFQRELIGQIDEQTIRARDIVRSLLDFARDRPLRREPVPLRPLVAQTLRFLRHQIHHGIRVLTDIPEDLVVQADRERLQQVLLNLVKNAAEAIPGEGTIEISAGRHRLPAAADTPSPNCTAEAHEACIDIRVRDTGTGMSPETAARVFDPFYTTKDVGKGSGLGLFVSYEIIENHGGCMAVDSHPERGTTFLIRLPDDPSETTP